MPYKSWNRRNDVKKPTIVTITGRSPVIGTTYSILKSLHQGHNQSYNSPRDPFGNLLLATNIHSYRSYRMNQVSTKVVYIRHYSPTFRVGRTIYRDISSQVVIPSFTFLTDQQISSAFYADANKIKISLAVAYRERQQTINLVAKTATKIYRAMRLVRKGKLRSASAALGFPGRTVKKRDSFADQWLEYHYGWIPLYSDIYGAMIATVPKPPSAPYKFTRKEVHSGVHTGQFGETEYVVKNRVTAKGFLVVDDPAVITQGELGLNNPALIAWELIPYSFVIDWFLPIGDWLQAQTALLGLTFKDTSITRSTHTYGVYRDSPSILAKTLFKDNAYDEYFIECGRVTMGERRKERRFGIPAKPSLRFQNPLSVSHAVTALALLNRFK